MDNLILGFALLVVGCGKGGEEETAEEIDTSEPADTDTDTDSDTDTDTDTDTDSGAAACTPADIQWRVEARLPDGTVPEFFTTSDTPVLAGIAMNTCEGEIRFDTDTDCLVKSWTVTGARGRPVEVTPTCSPIATSWTVPAMGSQEVTTDLRKQTAGDYTVDVVFGYQDTPATATFTVQ
jgi:hypothetical protein